MADGDDQDTLAGGDIAHDGPDNHEIHENHEGVVIEGLRPPLTVEQRRRRVAITAIVIAGALLILLWPAISAFAGALPSIQPFAQATATPNQSVRAVSALTVVTAGITGETGDWQSSSANISACPVTPQTTSAIGLPEMRADARGGEVWALLLTGSTIQANRATVMSWRATGSGAFQVVAIRPDGEQLSPTSGPDLHGGSNWDRPGEEWGTTFIFPQPGCWQLNVTRGAMLYADVLLLVAA